VRHLFGQTLRWQAARLAIVALASIGWGWLIPFFYAQFSEVLRSMARENPLIDQFSNFGSGNLLTVGGTITLGFQHPIAIAFVALFAVGAASLAIAGERQRGTLEVLLARPLPRNGVLLAMGAALLLAVVAVFGALLAGMVVSAAMQGLLADLAAGQLPLVILNGLLLWAAFLAFSLAASVSFDRAGPALGLSLAYLILNYFLEILGSLWTDAAWTQEYSLFHHFQPGEILAGEGDPMDLVILAVAVLIPLGYALIRFPRRDLAAPA
jgi:ABC-type transport system involved in multi-copper enzyme maturation permease subunit